MIFPKGFLWGASTSAYQIEGGYGEDGKGESIWDRFTHTPGRIHNNYNGDVACDHYHRYETDVKLMQELGDLVPLWFTVNEPWVSSFIGYWYGGHPPGITDFSTAFMAAHHTLLAHGRAVRAFRETGNKGEIGIRLNLNPIYPASEAEEDLLAAGRYADFYNGLFLDPVLKQQYPPDLMHWLSAHKVVLPEIKEGDMDLIHTSIDFIGVNNYSSTCVTYDPGKRPLQAAFMSTGKTKTDSGWEIYPEGLYDLLTYLHGEYNGIKILITENGAAFKDRLGNEGMVADDDRLGYLYNHITQAHKALSRGVNLAGYYVWSLFDNFEWNLGYSKKFGIVYIDYATQKRIIKKSGYWYGEVIKNNGIT